MATQANDKCRSCTLCRRRKIKCNRETPCNNCLRSKNTICEYAKSSSPPRPRPRHGQSIELAPVSEAVGNTSSNSPDQFCNSTVETQLPSRSSTTLVANSTSPSTPASQSTARDVELLKFKVKQLEERLSKVGKSSVKSAAPSPNWDYRTTTSHIAGTFHVHREPPSEGQAATMSRTIIHKTRMFGQSHWMYGVAQVSYFSV